jgi:hypothetical protein
MPWARCHPVFADRPETVIVKTRACDALDQRCAEFFPNADRARDIQSQLQASLSAGYGVTGWVGHHIDAKPGDNDSFVRARGFAVGIMVAFQTGCH